MRFRMLLVGLVFAGLVVTDAYAGATGNKELGEFGLDVLFVPVVACAYFFGTRGAVLAATVASSMSVILYSSADLYPPAVLATNMVLLCTVAGIVGVLIDRERVRSRRLERQSRVMERRHELSLEFLAAMEAGHFVEVNPVWERKLGYAPGDLLNRDFAEFIHPDDRAQVSESRERLAHGGEVTGQASRFRDTDGRFHWIEWSARHDDDDGRNYIAGRDITAKHEAEEALLLHREMLERAVAERTSDLRARTTELENTARELELARREGTRRLAMVAEFRDDRTAQHTERVGIAAALIARELGLSEQDIQLIREAAPLHDIGKIGTPDAILLNPRGLSDAEWTVMQQHTRLGHTLLIESRAPVLKVAALIALNHHEWWDGSGYPDGLAGEQIPLEAGIVAVADVFDALTHDRPYKPAWTLTEALDEINALSGRQFDPKIVDAFQCIKSEHLTALMEPDRPQTPLVLSHAVV
jgi:PAS domain S-box-containing protein/putative nucleotidyltransferase with HDIG domain